MLTINTNLSSLIVQSNLLNSTLGLNQAIERMTTGFKINHAKDNAAGYSISTNMSTKIGAYQTAEDNTLIGLDILNTASNSLELISNGLSRLRALAEQAANGTYDTKSLDAINSEANSIVDEIDKIYTSAEFNGVQLLKQDRLPSANFINEVTQVDTSKMTKLADVDETTTISSGSYCISTAEELKKLADMTNSGKVKDGFFYLADNIDLSAYQTGEGWTPIGTSSNPFRGTFNGNGYVVSNLYINTTATTSGIGLFGMANDISNLGVENAYVNAPNANSVGILVGSRGTISSVTLNNCYSTGEVIGVSNVGGLGGNSIGATACYSTADVTGKAYVGGVIGNGIISKCFSTGSVTGNSNVGGVAGSSSGTSNCYSTGRVSGNYYVGGIVGEQYGSFSNCYVLGRSDDLDGVFIGRASMQPGTLTNCYYSSYYTGKPLAGTAGYTFNNVQTYDGDVPYSYRPEYNSVKFDLQVGINSSDTSQITVDTSFDIWKLDSLRNIGYMNSSVMLNTVDDIISRVNERQTTLGAYQNRLESALEQISVQYENLVSSRSTIRDADIAEESSEYIKMQILQQASATLLATANQTPALALRLLGAGASE